jgi:hypothetical protein
MEGKWGEEGCHIVYYLSSVSSFFCVISFPSKGLIVSISILVDIIYPYSANQQIFDYNTSLDLF